MALSEPRANWKQTGPIKRKTGDDEACLGKVTAQRTTFIFIRGLTTVFAHCRVAETEAPCLDEPAGLRKIPGEAEPARDESR